jgi:hypothetical protein
MNDAVTNNIGTFLIGLTCVIFGNIFFTVIGVILLGYAVLDVLSKYGSSNNRE